MARSAMATVLERLEVYGREPSPQTLHWYAVCECYGIPVRRRNRNKATKVDKALKALKEVEEYE